MRQTRATFLRQEHHRLKEVLREARVRTGLSARAFSVQVGKQPTFMSRIERGERLLEVVEFLDLCHSLDLDPAAVIGKVVGNSPT